jgi:phosphohistidine phosphatase
MNLFLLRHGLAVERGSPGFANDAVRPLTPKGRRQLLKTTAALKKMELSFDLIFSSPLLRAKQTAEIVAGALKLKRRLVFAAELPPGGDAQKLIQRISALKPPPQNILLVGHEPALGELISLLVTGTAGAGFALKKGGLAKLEAERLCAGNCATLAWLLTPAQMKLMV